MIISKSLNQKISKSIQAGKIGVIPTDTIYGLVGSAMDKKVVEKIHKIKVRDDKKPFIILIASINDLKKFDIQLNNNQHEFISKYWPEKISIVLPLLNNKFDYLSRGNSSLTFRLPSDDQLIKLLQETGPIVAPSANPQGKPAAKTIKEAVEYFDDEIDFYVDKGEIKGNPSTLVDLTDKKPLILRQGDIKIPKERY